MIINHVNKFIIKLRKYNTINSFFNSSIVSINIFLLKYYYRKTKYTIYFPLVYFKVLKLINMFYKI